MTNRRTFFKAAGAAALGATAVSKVGAASLPEAVIQTGAGTLPPPAPPNGRPYNPVVTLNGWSLPWRMNNGVKEFHLVVEPVVREFAPGMNVNMWGFNGSSPGPTIEAVEGDRVRIFVTNKLPEPTSIHWHGILVPNGMDGVSGLTQPGIPVNKTFVYEFLLQRPGSHFYHSHLSEQQQLALGVYGCFVIHPKDPRQLKVDRDFMFMLASYDVQPGAATPKTSTMTDFNMWTFNNRVFPGIDPLVARTGDRVRIRVGNLTMTNHPIHMHGPHFEVTGTDGGWVPKSARWPEVTTDVGVGQLRAIEFDAIAGDWSLHCHKSHHTMNAMGHDVPNRIGVDQREVVDRIRALVPGYMAMGGTGMGDMSAMAMTATPPNTAPMMGGDGRYGSLEMGGRFSVVRARRDQPAGDYRDPGWFRHPAGTTAYEWTGTPPAAASQAAHNPSNGIEAQARKPDMGGMTMEHRPHLRLYRTTAIPFGDSMKTSLRLALATLATALSPLAFAHASLVASFPARDAVLTGSPAEIHITFNEHVEARYCRIKLVSNGGKNFDADRPQADKADPNAIIASVPVLRPGVYSARWTAVGGDGHKTHGDFSFTIK